MGRNSYVALFTNLGRQRGSRNSLWSKSATLDLITTSKAVGKRLFLSDVRWPLQPLTLTDEPSDLRYSLTLLALPLLSLAKLPSCPPNLWSNNLLDRTFCLLPLRRRRTPSKNTWILNSLKLKYFVRYLNLKGRENFDYSEM